MQQRWCRNLQECLNSGHDLQGHHVIKGNVVIRRSFSRSGPGKSASVQLYSSTQIDNNTGRGKLSEKSNLKDGKSSKENGIRFTTYHVTFHVDPEFGIPGVLIVKNQHNHEFFLHSATLEISGNRNIHFDCHSWVYPISKTEIDRIFFSHTSYLPNQTPVALRELRREELVALRGDGRGERKEWERIYDYDCYNDLGNPDKGHGHARPVLGGTSAYPYPRRGRTGRPPNSKDTHTESQPSIINLDIYVPPDERFSPKKMSEFISNSIGAIVHFLIPEAKSFFQKDRKNFESFDQLYEMYSHDRRNVIDSWTADKLKNLVPDRLFREIVKLSKRNPRKFPLPQIIAKENWAWKEDEEFGREMLSGINPAVIQSLKQFPPESKTGKRSSITASHIEHNLDGLTLQSAMEQWRIFILDHHDYLMPYLDRINSRGMCIYATRTLLFLRNDSTLKPVAIELSLPGHDEEEHSMVICPATQGTPAALWNLAKAHVVVNDSGHHQLISHWLHTHAVVEPFIIATRRQLSSMHPVHRLLDPHFKDNMHINALARALLLNSGGILERTMFPGRFSLELSSTFYKDWRFDEQALPADLLKRRMALEDPHEPSGVRMLFEDYPYAVDGLEIWTAIKTWVTDFCSIFYPTDYAVISDVEIQAWWLEIRKVGHGDKRDEKWWYQMNTISDLIQTLTILIWVASALHASVNFGQYGYAGFLPNRPTMCREFIPIEGTPEFAEFLQNPDQYYLKMLPERFTTTLEIALIEVLSTHMSDEEYLGQRVSLEWTDNEEVRRRLEKFKENLRQVENRILERNRDSRLKNRLGPAKVPYTLLYPGPDTSNVSAPGITGKGIPNSVSI
ncbi:putative linoleate 9S-lipoxygenase 4 [Tasmannia lanceolata]|uniref:putative linoleate 9S-lipoxygenase 4 n=1 Tax=Tasmannia lanceolata TaxID=3420 RepID=UPI0040635E06